jgi:hypothetical protein
MLKTMSLAPSSRAAAAKPASAPCVCRQPAACGHHLRRVLSIQARQIGKMHVGYDQEMSACHRVDIHERRHQGVTVDSARLRLAGDDAAEDALGIERHTVEALILPSGDPRGVASDLGSNDPTTACQAVAFTRQRSRKFPAVNPPSRCAVDLRISRLRDVISSFDRSVL